MIDVLCVGAHPDDVELGMGATIAGMIGRSLSVVLVDLTDGEPTPRGSAETRSRESAAAAAALGVDGRITLGLPNRELEDTPEARRKLAEIVRETRPRILFAPYPHDAHPDHVTASAIVRAARFWAKFTRTDMSGDPHYPSRLYQYYALHLHKSPRPSFVVDASEDFAAKMDALGQYRSQFSENPVNRDILRVVELHGEYWGSLIGRTHGEPFFSPEEIGVASVMDLL